MTIPVTLPAPATTGKAGSSAPSKGVASAAGQSSDATATDATGVTDMFAALVATLTAQMQPVANEAAAVVTGEVAAEGAPVTVTAPALAAVLAEAGVDAADAADAVPAPAVTADAAEATPQAATPVLADGDVVPTSAVPTLADTDQAGDAKAAAPAGPAAPATPVGEAEGPATPATPATPAQPQAATQTDAAATALLAPNTAAAPTDKPEVDRGIAAVPATTATPASAATDRAGAATPARAATPPADPHIQVARVVRPLRLGNDGTYELALDLTPAELGRVRIDVELRGATISMTLRADNPATRDLLQSSLDQLRSELEAAGLHAGNLDVGGRGASDRGGDDQQAGAAGISDVAADVVDATSIQEPTITAEDTASGVNVLA